MSGYIYFVTNGRAIKIGYSAQPGRRFGNLRGGTDTPLEFLGVTDGDRENERALHRELSAFRLEGEWFVDCAPVRERVASALKDGLPKIERKSRSLSTAEEDDQNVPLQLREHSERLARVRDDFLDGRIGRDEFDKALADSEVCMAWAVEMVPGLSEVAGPGVCRPDLAQSIRDNRLTHLDNELRGLTAYRRSLEASAEAFLREMDSEKVK